MTSHQRTPVALSPPLQHLLECHASIASTTISSTDQATLHSMHTLDTCVKAHNAAAEELVQRKAYIARLPPSLYQAVALTGMHAAPSKVDRNVCCTHAWGFSLLQA